MLLVIPDRHLHMGFPTVPGARHAQMAQISSSLIPESILLLSSPSVLMLPFFTTCPSTPSSSSSPGPAGVLSELCVSSTLTATRLQRLLLGLPPQSPQFSLFSFFRFMLEDYSVQTSPMFCYSSPSGGGQRLCPLERRSRPSLVPASFAFTPA